MLARCEADAPEISAPLNAVRWLTLGFDPSAPYSGMTRMLGMTGLLLSVLFILSIVIPT
jgi:hypothetical protein